MCSNDAFCMLARLRECCTHARRSSASAALAAAIASSACVGGVSVPAGDETVDATWSEAAGGDAPTPSDERMDPPMEPDGSDADDASAVPLCVRLRDPDRPVKILDLSTEVRNGYLLLVSGDCRLDGLFPTRSADLAAWSNRLYDWNLDLWGCSDRAPNGFALIPDGVGNLTSSDAALLVDDYLMTATRALRLSSKEAAEMKRQLDQLALGAITSQSEDHPFSACDADTNADAAPGDEP
jgi:hypothetical protein